jgi:hypothetical protein
MLPMTPQKRIRKLFTFPIDAELAEGLRRLEERDGTTKAEAIRRGIRLYLESEGVSVKKKRTARPRKRAR